MGVPHLFLTIVGIFNLISILMALNILNMYYL